MWIFPLFSRFGTFCSVPFLRGLAKKGTVTFCIARKKSPSPQNPQQQSEHGSDDADHDRIDNQADDAITPTQADADGPGRSV